MSIVYVVQQQLHKDTSGILVPKFDLTDATRYGKIEFVLNTDDSAAMPKGKLMNRLQDRLQRITDEDYILPIGSPIMISMVSVVASFYVDNLNFLYWNRRAQEYWVESFELPIVQ